MPTTPSVSPLLLLLALSRAEPGSRAFLSMLELLLRSKEKQEQLAQLTVPAARHAADALDKLVGALVFYNPPEYRKRTLRLLRSLCGKWGIVPTSYRFQSEVRLLDKHPYISASRFAEVFRGMVGEEMVAVKALTVYLSEDPSRVNKKLSEEAVIWKHLRHPNILPLYGVSFTLRGSRPCLVSPWMPNGNIRDFAVNNPHFDRFKLLVDVCMGLQYLHAQDIVHGDLKGDNVLIGSDFRAHLADFGMANLDRSRWLGVTSNSTTPGGTHAYMAPELFFHRSEEPQSKGPLMRKEVDIYALGMLIYEVLSGKRPFHKVPDHLVILKVVALEERPQRPPSKLIPDHVWEMLQLCWDKDPTRRPGIKHITVTCGVLAARNLPVVWSPPPKSPSSYSGDDSSATDGSMSFPVCSSLNQPLPSHSRQS